MPQRSRHGNLLVLVHVALAVVVTADFSSLINSGMWGWLLLVLNHYTEFSEVFLGCVSELAAFPGVFLKQSQTGS